jgi:hypothetical protein
VKPGSFQIDARADEEGSSNKEFFHAPVTLTRPFSTTATEVTQAERHERRVGFL